MRKLKKVLAGILSAAMMLSGMSMMAFAAEPDTILEDTGSLTITKREAETNVPIEGVEFSLYKLADITQTVSGGTVDTDVKPVAGTGLSKGDLEKIANGTSSAAEWAELAKKVQFDDLTAYTSGKTNANGVVAFSNLPLGIYAVRETDAPSQVISKSANFIVSIPMTSDDGDNWIYDITAEPKNAVSRGGVKLHKSGKTGNSSEKENLAGVEFVLQHKTAEGNWESVEGQYVTDETGLITVENLNPGTYRFVEKSLGNNNGYIMDGKAVYEFELKIDEADKLTHIWYDSNGDGTKEDEGAVTAEAGYTIEVLNEKPTLEKTVKDGNSYDNETDASIGDTVEWKVEASVPSKVGQMNKYTLQDTMSAGLTWVSADAANLTITTTPDCILTAGTDYNLTVPEDGAKGGSWTIEFTETGRKALDDANVTTVTVTFKTVLNEDAKIANDGGAGNLNEADLTYSNSILPDEGHFPGQPETPGEDVIRDEATVYTFGLGVEKVDGQDNETKLAGVTFDLYKYNGNKTEGVTESDLKGNDGSKINVSGTDGVYKVDAAGNAVLTTDANGNIVVNGLEKGTYYLVETKTNDGYNLLKAPVKVAIAVTFTTKTTTTTTTAADGTVTTTTVTTDTFTGGTADNGIIKTVIENNKGFELPTTGGMGTLLFSIIGGILMIGGAVVLFRSKKKA